MNTVTRSFLRYMFRRRGLTILQFLGIACGVAATVGIVLSARAALTGFSKAIEFLKGKSTHSIERPAGPMDEGMLVRLMRDPAVEAFSPVIERSLRLSNGETARILGIDPFLDKNLRPELAYGVTTDQADENLSDRLAFLTKNNAVLVEAQLAQRLGVSAGGIIHLVKGDFEVVGVFPNPSGEPILLMDIGHAQRLFGMNGRLDRVDLILNDGPGFLSRWENGYHVQTSLKRRETLAHMLRAFRLNLEALSLLALFVGIFLIYNTAMFAVVSRKKDAGILRSLGAHRSEIIAAFLTEILLLGSFGGMAGGVLGYFLSRLLAGEVGGTISNLYFFLHPVPPSWSLWIIVAGTLMGGIAGLLGSLWPLLELVRTDPARALSGRTAERRSGANARTLAAIGAGLILLSLLVFFLSSTQVYAGFAGAFGFLIGASLLTGLALVLISPLLKRTLARLGGLPGKVAAGNIHLNLGRTAVAVAAFMVALSMSIGLSTMIGSFRRSVEQWLENQISGDLYISSMDELDVPVSFYDELRAMKGIEGVDPYRNTLTSFRGTSAYVSAVDAAVLQRFSNFAFLKGGRENWDRVKAGEVIISESFARRFGVKAGDTVTLDAVHGPAELTVAAVFYDYTSEHGILMMDRAHYRRLFEDPTITSLGIFVDPRDPRRGEILVEVARRAGEHDLPVFTRDQLHANALRVFDSAFAVTTSMRVLAIIVAFFGIAGAILTLFIERQREFGIYRALGFSTLQVAGITLMEGVAMGLLSFLMSLGVGTAMAAILIQVINLRSFNWTVFFYPTGAPYLLAAATALLAGLGGSLYPIFKAWRTYPQMQIREE
ncbi:MAG: ABC transporter permease [Candidatus Aminicenantes bacterium]|nr:ABC transporter permease [Candidatus Aminicenantes bacterium]